MSRLRILHALFSSRIAGSERYCIDLANRQAEEGHEVHVAGTGNSPIAEELSPAVTFHGFATPFFRRWRLRRLAEQLEVDVCHGHLSGACKALRSRGKRSRTIATLHVGYKPHQHAHLDALICVNQAQRGRLGDYRGLARTIPNWLPARPDVADGPRLRRELGIGEEVFLIGAVGRLHPSKGMDVLLTAFRAAALPDAHLVILGEGEQRAQLERLAAGDDRIHLAGYRTDVHACLPELDLFVSPSREESFGLAILEAMAAGLPIVSTRADGPAEFLRDQPAVLVPIGSPEAVAEAMTEARAKAGATRRARVVYALDDFDGNRRMAGIIELYRHVITAPSWPTANETEEEVVPA